MNKAICGWCGQHIVGVNEFEYEASGVMMSCGSEVQIEVIPQVSVSFCCEGCAWAFLVAEHRLMGMTEFEVRRHIVEYHGIMPAAAAGPESLAHRQRCDEVRARYYQMRGWTSSEVVTAS
jgi:hypothetical protein